jgi:hypothetical protein
MMRRILLSAVILGVCSSASAAPFGFGIATDQNLYSIDLGAATATLIGPTLDGFFEAIALSPGGQLFGTNTGGQLYSIDPNTGLSTFIGATGRGNIEGLDFLGDTLIGIDFAAVPTVFSINPANASTVDIVTSLVPTGATRAMTVLDANTLLIRSDLGGANVLRSLNLNTGASVVIGDMGGGHGLIPGLDFAVDGNLYGLAEDGSVLLINPANASNVVIGNTGEQFWLALAAAQQVPEPSSLLLCGLGLLLVLARRRV